MQLGNEYTRRRVHFEAKDVSNRDRDDERTLFDADGFAFATQPI